VKAGEAIDWNRDTRTVTHATQAGCDAANAAKAQTPEVKLDLSGIVAFLKAAQERGLKFPKLRVLDADGRTELRLHLTTMGSAPGSVSVKHEGVWVGMVRPDGEVRGQLAGNQDRQRVLVGVAADPDKAAKSYAAVMNRCCFCGKDLTDDGSVEAGYGPVCAEKWGLEHHRKGTKVLAMAAA